MTDTILTIFAILFLALASGAMFVLGAVLVIRRMRLARVNIAINVGGIEAGQGQHVIWLK